MDYLTLVAIKMVKVFPIIYQFSSKEHIPSISNFLNDHIFKNKKNSKKLFLSFENSIKYKKIKADYYFTGLLGIDEKKHFRIPYWKNCANWPEYDIFLTIVQITDYDMDHTTT